MSATVTPDATVTRADASSLVERADRLLRELDREDLAARVRGELRRVRRPSCDVLVVGEFKKGKSTVVNALLNARVCPSDPDRFTSVPTIVRHGERVRVHALLAAGDDVDGGADLAETVDAGRGRDLDLADLPDAITDIGDPGEEEIRSVVVDVPRGLLAEGLVLVDTPGVGGGLTSAHAAATLRALAMARAVVFVTDASQELTEPEVDFLVQARRLCPTVLVVCTKTDVYPEWRRIVAIDREHLRRRDLPDVITPVAAPLRHHALRTGDADLDRESGFPGLVTHLREEVLARQAELAGRAAASVVVDTLGQVAETLDAELAALRDPGAEQRLIERVRQAQRDEERLTNVARNWLQILQDRFGDMVTSVDADLSLRLRRLRDEIVVRVNESDPVEEWPQLEAWVNKRTNEVLVAHFEHMRDEADGVVEDMLARFELDVHDVDLHRGLGGGGVPAVAAPSAPEFSELSRGQLGLTALRGSTGGVIAASTVTGVLQAVGAAAGMAVGVLSGGAIIGGVGLGVMMARRALSGARESQTKANQNDAIRSFTRHLEQVEILARRDSRTTLRRVHQRMRNYCKVRAGEAETSARQTREATVRAVRGDHATRKERLSAAEEQRTRVADLQEEAMALMGPLAPTAAASGSSS